MSTNILIEGRRLEALADGELSEGERRELLLRLDREPDGWRRLAVAFLEAQALREALGEKAAARTIVPLAAPPSARRWRRPGPVGWLAAAAVIAAFLLGLAARPRAEQHAGDAERHAAVPPGSVARQASPSLAEQLAQAAPTLSVDERRELERRGFQVRERPRLVHVEMGGRTTPVFVNEVELRYVGKNSAL